MAMRERLVYAIDVVTDGVDTGLNRISSAMRNAEGATASLKAGWQAAVTEFRNSREAQALAIGAASAVAARAISDYSNLEESVNAVNVQYGVAASGVRKLGEDSAESFGMSQRAFNEFAVGFSAFANQIAAAGGQQVNEVVDEMATRIADFASVNNLSLQEAEQVAKSTLAGETEAFRRFGGDVSAATVEAYAFQTGIADVGSELTEGEKVLARYGLFMDQTARTAGDFANTSDGLANQQRILAAKVEDLSAKLGGRLYPAASNAAGAVIVLADAIDYLSTKGSDVNDQMPGFVQGLVDIGERAVNPIAQIGFVADGLNELGGAAEDATPPMLDLADADRAHAVGAERVRLAQESANAEIDRARMYAEYAEGATQALTEAEEAAERQARDNIAVIRRLTEEYNTQKQRIDDLIGKKNALIGGDIAVRQAQRDAKAAAEELNEVIKTQGDDLGAVGAALDGATESYLGAAQSAADFRADQLEANGSIVDGRVRTQLLKEELQNLANGVDGPLRAAIQRYIDDLGRIPANVNTRITANGTPGSVPIVPGSRYATGTRSATAGVALVGENGPELVELNGGERIWNARETGQIMGNQSSGGSVASGGLYVAPGAIVINGNVSGDDVVRALDNYVRRGGFVPADVRRKFSA